MSTDLDPAADLPAEPPQGDPPPPFDTAATLPTAEEQPPQQPEAVPAAAQALRERLASQGIELADEVQLAEVPGHVLEALLEAMPPSPGPRHTEEELRRELAERIATSHRLPRGVRERLAATMETVRFDDTGRDEPALRVSDAVALLEQSLPAHVLLSPDEAEPATHPRGEAFFTGDARSMSDDDARRLAADQLARTGYRKTA